MNRRRNSCGLAAAVAVLLAGLAPARGDDLSDLRVKQQQLQQQLDQLQGESETPPGETAAPNRPPVAGGSFPRSFVIPGTNTSLSIGGSVQRNFVYGIQH
jgi:hypothetical protein